MSYTIRVDAGAFGLLDLPDYVSISFGWDISEVGGLDLKYAKQGVNATHLKDDAIVIVYWDGVELADSRYILQSGSDNADPQEDYITVKGKSNLDVFRRVVVRHTTNPGSPVTFDASTPGFILKTFIDVAQSRGRLVGITYNFTAAADSAGTPWPTTYTVEYKAGATYLAVIHDLVDKGFVEVRMVGNQLNAYITDAMGTDLTTGSNPLELRYGLDYSETANKWSAETRSGYSLIVGDEGLYAEYEDMTVPPGPYGRAEQAISQSGVNDIGALNLINLYRLQIAKDKIEQFTRHVTLRPDGPVPGVDYKVGDHIYDRVEGLPERYRVLSIAVGVEEGKISDAAVVLNDKFTDREIRNQRRIESIIGGGTGEGGGGVTTPESDKSIPKPPTGLGISSGSYVDPVDGFVKVVATTSWAAPTQNTDNSQLRDLSHYEVEEQISKDSTNAALDKWYPARADKALQSRWDRRGKDTANNWIGADGGSSARAANGDDWFFWSDTAWGKLSKTGVETLAAMPRNSITMSDPTSGNDLRFAGSSRNLLSDNVAYGSGGWTASSGTTCAAVASAWGANGKAVRAEVTGASNRYIVHTAVPVEPNTTYLLHASFNPASTAGGLEVRYQKNGTGTSIAVPSTGRVTTDASTTSLRLLLLTTGAVGTWFEASYAGIYKVDHSLMSWQPQTHSEEVFNEVPNPDGAYAVSAGATTTMLQNYSPNPSAEVDDSSWGGLYTETTRQRVVDPSAWAGDSFVRFTMGSATTGNAAMHFPVEIPTNKGWWIARFRVRGSRPGVALIARIHQFIAGAGNGSSGTNVTVTLTGDWQTVEVPAHSLEATSNRLGVMLVKSGLGSAQWQIGDTVDVDGMEVYNTKTLPPYYFDGATVTGTVEYNPGWSSPGRVDTDGTILQTSGYTKNYSAPANSTRSASLQFTNPTSETLTAVLQIRYTLSSAFGSEGSGPVTTRSVEPGKSIRLYATGTLATTSDGYRVFLGSASPGLVVSDLVVAEGPTALPPEYETSWSGTAHLSASNLRLTPIIKRNYMHNPGLVSNTSGWTATTGATLRRVNHDVPGYSTPTGVLPEIVNPSALTPFTASYVASSSKSVGIAVIGDSTAESTGNISNPNLSERFIERLQALLRRSRDIAGVPNDPPGYYGASTYIPVGYIHDGPKDWVFETSDPVLYPLNPLQVGFGAGGRFRNVGPGHRAHFTARFDRVRLSLVKSGWGRMLRVLIDGEQKTVLNTFGTDGELFNASWIVEPGEHTVVLEYVPIDGLGPGSCTILGADIWDGDFTKGIRVYDLAGSGKAAQDAANGVQVEQGLRRLGSDGTNFIPSAINLLVIMLGFNDFGRDAAWGGPRTRFDFKNDVKAIISKARAEGYTGPVLLVGQWDAPTLAPGSPGETLANFRAKLNEIANEDSTVAYINLSTVMPPVGSSDLYVDTVHPSEKGHARIAEILHRTLVPHSSGPYASAYVETSGTAIQQGVTITPTPTTPWPINTPYAVGVWVKAPAGALMQLRVLATGNPGTTTPFTGTGDWQWVQSPVSTVDAGATAAPWAIVRTQTAVALSFLVTKALVTRGPADQYFDGYTPGTAFAWEGVAGASSSTEATVIPNGWIGSSPVASTVRFDPHTYSQGAGSILVETVDGSTYHYVSRSLVVPAGKHVTITGLVRANYPIQRVLPRLRDGSTYIGGTTAQYTLLPHSDGWSEFRWDGVIDVASTQMIVVVYCDPAQITTEQKTWFTELTVVVKDAGAYRGTPFHGGQFGHGVDNAQWLGTPHNSRSKVMLYNSSSAPSFDQPGALWHPAAAGGGIDEYLWVTSAQKVPTANRAVIICNGMRNRALREQSGWNFQRNGSIYLVEVDMTNKTIVRFIKWFDDLQIQWGEACWFDGSYFYVYGASANALGKGQVHLMRVPASDIANGPREFWTGVAWSGSGTPAVLATMTAGGAFSAVRTFNGKWIALYCAGYMTEMEGWSADNPQGPWTKNATPVYKFPEDLLEYVPRFHPQMDDNAKGIAISYSAAGEGVYGAKFLRGPAGDLQMLFGDNEWSNRRETEVSPDHRGGLGAKYLYATRVRAVDRTGNTSAWAYAPPLYLEGDTDAPPQPSKPLVTSFFRGVKIYIDGLTAAGGSQPIDFLRFAIHASFDEGFEPDESNLVDSIYTATGGTSIVSDVPWNNELFVKIVTWDRSDNYSIPSEVASAVPERLSDAELPAKLIDGAKHIKDESINLKHLTVGAFDQNSIVPNGNMEDWDGTSEFPTGWEAGWPSGNYTTWEEAAQFAVEETNPLAGSKSIRITPRADSSRQLRSRAFPVTPGDIYYVKAVIETDKPLAGDYISLNLLCGHTLEDVNGFGGSTSYNGHVGSGGSNATSKYTIEGQVEVPDEYADGSGYAMRFAAVGVAAGHNGTAPYTVWVDDVEVRQIVGEAALANASINRAKIRYLAVDDARISSVGVGKLTAGELWADITVSARVMTSKTGQRVEMNRDGLFGFNGTDSTPVTEVRADNGGLISRWFRTNTAGTRIEMGTYGMGANSALMSFHPDSTTWQFPPAFGFGGGFRQGTIPGLAMHAGSYSTTNYDAYGMNMIAVDQQGGAHLYTGNLLDGTQASLGSPINLNAGGQRGVIDVRSGTRTGGSVTDRSRIYLSPREPGHWAPEGQGYSRIDLNFGTMSLMPSGTWGEYSLRFSDPWGNAPWHHMLVQCGYGGFRISTANQTNAFIVSPGGVIRGSGWNAAAKIQGEGSDDYYCSFYADSQNVGIRVYDAARNLIVNKVIP